MGEFRTYVNLMLVMLLGGLWHGASWNFVIWGGIHGGMLAIERTRSGRSFFGAFPRSLRIALTFLIMCLAWVFFRSETLTGAGSFLKSLFGQGELLQATDAIAATIYTPYHISIFGVCGIIVWCAPQVWDFTQKLTPAKAGVIFGLLVLSIAFLWTQTVNPFLYFQF
jgi:alginate O-acetyltransferase complex protein AlgI